MIQIILNLLFITIAPLIAFYYCILITKAVYRRFQLNNLTYDLYVYVKLSVSTSVLVLLPLFFCVHDPFSYSIRYSWGEVQQLIYFTAEIYSLFQFYTICFGNIYINRSLQNGFEILINAVGILTIPVATLFIPTEIKLGANKYTVSNTLNFFQDFYSFDEMVIFNSLVVGLVLGVFIYAAILGLRGAATKVETRKKGYYTLLWLLVMYNLLIALAKLSIGMEGYYMIGRDIITFLIHTARVIVLIFALDTVWRLVDLNKDGGTDDGYSIYKNI